MAECTEVQFNQHIRQGGVVSCTQGYIRRVYQDKNHPYAYAMSALSNSRLKSQPLTV